METTSAGMRFRRMCQNEKGRQKCHTEGDPKFHETLRIERKQAEKRLGLPAWENRRRPTIGKRRASACLPPKSLLTCPARGRPLAVGSTLRLWPTPVPAPSSPRI